MSFYTEDQNKHILGHFWDYAVIDSYIYNVNQKAKKISKRPNELMLPMEDYHQREQRPSIVGIRKKDATTNKTSNDIWQTRVREEDRGEYISKYFGNIL